MEATHCEEQVSGLYLLPYIFRQLPLEEKRAGGKCGAEDEDEDFGISG